MDEPDEAVVNVINPDEEDEEVIEGSLLLDGGVLLPATEDPSAATKTLSKFSEAWRRRLCLRRESPLLQNAFFRFRFFSRKVSTIRKPLYLRVVFTEFQRPDALHSEY